MLNLEGHLNRCIGSKVTAILLNGYILPTGGVASVMVCLAAGLFYIVSNTISKKSLAVVTGGEGVAGNCNQQHG